MAARLTSDFRVRALMAQAHSADAFAALLFRGDAERGAILLKVRRSGALCLLRESATGPDGEQIWQPLPDRAEAEADALIAKRRRFDRDLWVVEIDDPASRFDIDQI
ncbi:MAG: DUF1491 family protein [Rhodothalassiaceae bacterium]